MQQWEQEHRQFPKLLHRSKKSFLLLHPLGQLILGLDMGLPRASPRYFAIQTINSRQPHFRDQIKMQLTFKSPTHVTEAFFQT